MDVAMPFPVEVPYQVKADLKRVDEDVFSPDLVVRDGQAKQYLSAKLVALSNPALSGWVVQHSALESSVMTSLLDYFVAITPDLIVPIHARAWQFVCLGLQCDEAGEIHVNRLLDTLEARCVQWLMLQPKAHRLWHCLAFSLQEDFALMHQTDQGFTAEALHVCFPSGWSPSVKFSQDLGQIHGPVADGDRLRASTKPLAVAMVNKGPFVRYVWTLSAYAHLSEHPLLKAQRSAANTSKTQVTTNPVYFRCERQITIPFAAYARSLFLIRVFVAPLQTVLTPARAATLATAIDSMSPASKQYKSIEHLIQPALDICQQIQTNSKQI